MQIQHLAAAIINPPGIQIKRFGSIPWVTAAKIRAPDKYINSFLRGLIKL